MSDRSLDPDEVDAAFADIVTRLGDIDRTPPPGAPQGRDAAVNPPFRIGSSTPSSPPSWPVHDEDERPTPHPSAVPWRTDPTHSVADALLRDVGAEDADDDEGFHPAPVAPLPPTSDRTFWVALVGLVAGPLLLVWSAVVGEGWSLWTWLGLALTVGGFAAVVLRQPGQRDDLDDGARV